MKPTLMIFAFLLVATSASAQGGDADCDCTGTWVQGSLGPPVNGAAEPAFIHEFLNEPCSVATVPPHNDLWEKIARVVENGGSCQQLNWIPELATLFDDTHDILVAVVTYDIPGGHKALEYMNWLNGTRYQTFKCVDEGVTIKELQRFQLIQWSHFVDVEFEKIADCIAEPEPVEPPPGA